MVSIYSETPSMDVWRRLRAYTSNENVADHLSSRHPGQEVLAEVAADVVSSIEQGAEYFVAGAQASLSTHPVHLYYGTVSLLRALTLIKTNAPLSLGHHGMTHSPGAPAGDVITGESANLEVSASGGLAAYSAMLRPGSAPSRRISVSLADALGAIPEVREEFLRCAIGEHRAIPVERIYDSKGALTDRIRLADLGGDTKSLLAGLPEVSRVYLPLATTVTDFVILRPRLGVHDDPTLQDGTGKRFFLLPMTAKGGQLAVHRLVPHLVALFILSSLSRYHPARWRAFCTSSARTTFLVEGYLRVAQRFVPNEILNLVENRTLVFTPSRISDTHVAERFSPEDMQKSVEQAVADHLQRYFQGRQ